MLSILTYLMAQKNLPYWQVEGPKVMVVVMMMVANFYLYRNIPYRYYLYILI